MSSPSYHLIEEEGRQEVVALAVRASPNLAFYAIVLVLALVSPRVAAFGFLGTAVIMFLRVPGQVRRPGLR